MRRGATVAGLVPLLVPLIAYAADGVITLGPGVTFGLGVVVWIAGMAVIAGAYRNKVATLESRIKEDREERRKADERADADLRALQKQLNDAASLERAITNVGQSIVDGVTRAAERIELRSQNLEARLRQVEAQMPGFRESMNELARAAGGHEDLDRRLRVIERERGDR